MSITAPDRRHEFVSSLEEQAFAEDELLDVADEFEEALAADMLKRHVIEAWL